MAVRRQSMFLGRAPVTRAAVASRAVPPAKRQKETANGPSPVVRNSAAAITPPVPQAVAATAIIARARPTGAVAATGEGDCVIGTPELRWVPASCGQQPPRVARTRGQELVTPPVS